MTIQEEIDELNQILIGSQAELEKKEIAEDQAKQVVDKIKKNIAHAETAIKTNLYVCQKLNDALIEFLDNQKLKNWNV